MMTRDDMNEMVVDYLYDDLSAESRAAFEEALPSYPELSAEVRSNTALRQALRSIKPAPVPAGLAQRIMASAEQESAKRAPETGSFFSWLTGLIMQPAFATAMVFAVVGGTTFVLNEPGESLSDPSYEEPRSVSTGNTVAASRAPAPSVESPPPPSPRPAAAPAAQAPMRQADGSRMKEKEQRPQTKNARRAPRMKGKTAKRSKPKVAIALADTKEELYRGLGSKNLSSQVAEAAADDPAKISLSHKTQAGKADTPIKFAEETPKPSKVAPIRQSNKRLVAAFERALKKRQFGEARKLLGLIGQRPELRKFYKAKRALIPTKKSTGKGK